jgi:hypothetical protein
MRVASVSLRGGVRVADMCGVAVHVGEDRRCMHAIASKIHEEIWRACFCACPTQYDGGVRNVALRILLQYTYLYGI